MSNRCFYVDGADKPQTMTTKMAERREILKIDDHKIVRKQKNFGGIIFSDKAKISFIDCNFIMFKI
jgi:hypothetical protein